MYIHLFQHCHSPHPWCTKYGSRIFITSRIGSKRQISHEEPRGLQTLQIEINVQLAGLSQEDPIFHTNDDDETEEQYWALKEAI